MEKNIAASFSMGRVAHGHNKREPGHIQGNVDQSLSEYNVGLIDELQGRTTEQYVNEVMQGVIDDYNKGKKPCRQIQTDYCTYREQNKNLKGSPLEYEAVVQCGEHETLGKDWYDAVASGDKIRIEKLHAAFTEYYKDALDQFQEKFPHLKVIEADIHFDEPNGTPHMHIDFIPFGEPNKGLPYQVSIGAALKNDGIDRVKSKQEALELGGYQMTRMFNICQEEILKPKSLELARTIDPEQYKDSKTKYVNPGKKHQTAAEYYALQNLKDQFHKQLDKCQQTTETIKKLEKKVDDLEKLDIELEKKAKELKKTCRDLEEQKKFANENLELLKQEKDHITATFPKKGLFESAADYQQRTKEHQHQLEEIQSKIAKAEFDVNTLTRALEMDAKEKLYDDLRRDHQNLKNQFDLLEETYKIREGQIARDNQIIGANLKAEQLFKEAGRFLPSAQAQIFKTCLKEIEKGLEKEFERETNFDIGDNQ